MNFLLSIYIFMLGAALGSFALVVSERWQAKKSWVKGRSQCDSCKKELQAIDLVPIFSWILMRGKCRHCNKKVSVRYPLAELLSGFTLLFVFYWFPYELMTSGLYDVKAIMLFCMWLLVHTLSMVLIFTDIKSMLMPYAFLLPLIAVSVVFRMVILVSDISPHGSLLSLVIGVLLGGGLFSLLWLVSRGKWIGDSDILLGVAIAFIVGGAVEVWIAFVSASVVGLGFGVLLAVNAHKKLRHMKLPFGPFLILGMIISFLFSHQLIDLYLQVFTPY